MKSACVLSCSAMSNLKPGRRTPSFNAVMLGRSIVVSPVGTKLSNQFIPQPPHSSTRIPGGLLQCSNSSQICMYCVFRVWLASCSSSSISSQIAGMKRRPKRKMLPLAPQKEKKISPNESNCNEERMFPLVQRYTKHKPRLMDPIVQRDKC